MAEVSIACGVCPGTIGEGAASCPGCGRPVTDGDRMVMQVRLEGGHFPAFQRGRKVRQAVRWIGLLAVLYGVWTPIVFAMGQAESERVLVQLAPYDDSDALEPIDGIPNTVGEARRAIRRVPLRSSLGLLILAGLMGGLWLWARHAPLPAIACALALFIVVQVVAALVEPTSIYKGLPVHVFGLVVLGKGLHSAMEARAELRRLSR